MTVEMIAKTRRLRSKSPVSRVNECNRDFSPIMLAGLDAGLSSSRVTPVLESIEIGGKHLDHSQRSRGSVGPPREKLLEPRCIHPAIEGQGKAENRMFTYRFLLASMLLIAFLNLGHAQESGEMPAELDMSVDQATKQGPGYHINGTIPLQLPNTDGTFVVKTKVRPHWRLTPVQGKCSVNEALITVQVAGKRNHDQLTLTLSFAPEVLQLPACGNDRLTEGTHKLTVSTGNLNSREFRLFVTDGSSDELTAKDSLNLGRLTGKLTLHLACPVRLVVGESVPEISVSPADAVHWPLLFDDSKTPAELSALAAGSSSVLGLTRPSKPYPPLAFFRPASRHATLRQGVCFWVKSIEVKFTPVEILLANEYPPGSCE
jgi:hypothetical protein